MVLLEVIPTYRVYQLYDIITSLSKGVHSHPLELPCLRPWFHVPYSALYPRQ